MLSNLCVAAASFAVVFSLAEKGKGNFASLNFLNFCLSNPPFFSTNVNPCRSPLLIVYLISTPRFMYTTNALDNKAIDRRSTGGGRKGGGSAVRSSGGATW